MCQNSKLLGDEGIVCRFQDRLVQCFVAKSLGARDDWNGTFAVLSLPPSPLMGLKIYALG